MTPHPLNNFDMQKHYQKDLCNKSWWVQISWNAQVRLVCKWWKCNTYFDSFGVQHILKEVWKFIENKNIATNIYKLQAWNSTMCGYFCIGFIYFMLKGKDLLDYTSLFSPNEFEKNDEVPNKCRCPPTPLICFQRI